MRLKLAEDTPEHRALSRIERYVEVTFQYIRIGSGTKERVLRKYTLDKRIREVVRQHLSLHRNGYGFAAKRWKT